MDNFKQALDAILRRNPVDLDAFDADERSLLERVAIGIEAQNALADAVERLQTIPAASPDHDGLIETACARMEHYDPGSVERMLEAS